MALNDPYVTADELAEHLGITARDHDDALTRAAHATSRWVDGYCNRTFNLAATATTRYFDTHDSSVLWVDDIGDDTIIVATDVAEDGNYSTEWDDTDIQLEPVNALSIGEPVRQLIAVGSLGYPQAFRRRGVVSVTASWGWPAVPDGVKLACLIQASRLFKRRESPDGVLGGGDFGIVRVGTRLDPDVADLLSTYRLVKYGVA